MLSSLFALFILAQGPPATKLIQATIQEDAKSIQIKAAQVLSLPDGYNNQPHFIDEHSFLFTGIYDGQADIYRYDNAKTTQLTHTPESEYSPTPMPNGKEFSVIQVEADGTQRLHAFPMAGGSSRVLLPTVKPVGYHLWLNEDELALFILGEPHTLQLANLKTQKTEHLMENVGRCLSKRPGHKGFTAVRMGDTPQSPAEIVHIRPLTRSIKPITKTLEQSQDYLWTPQGHLLMAKNREVYRWQGEKGWILVADLAHLKTGAITRMACSRSGKNLILVADQE